MLTPEGKRCIRHSLQYRLYLLGVRLTGGGFALGLLLFGVLATGPPVPIARVCAVLVIADFIVTPGAVIFMIVTTVALGLGPIRQVGGIVPGHTIGRMVLVDFFRAPLSPRRHRDDNAATSEASTPQPPGTRANGVANGTPSNGPAEPG